VLDTFHFLIHPTIKGRTRSEPCSHLCSSICKWSQKFPVWWGEWGFQ